MSNPVGDLTNGVVLAELGGYGDGPYCAKHGADAALVMLGTYIVDSGNDVPYPEAFVFKPDRSSYMPYLLEHIAAARAGGSRVGVSVATVEISRTLEFLSAAEAGGADYASLCAHSSMEMFVREDLGERLCRRENAALLKEWASGILDRVSIPVIFKIGLTEPGETVDAVHTLASTGIPVVHINIRQSQPASKGLDVLGGLSGVCQCLIGGGGIQDIQGARRVLAAGADAIAIGTAAMKDPALCGHIQEILRERVSD